MATALALAANVDIEVGARSVFVPVPFVALLTWKKLLKLAPVEAAPMFEIVEVNVSGVPAAAEVGVVAEAVKSGMLH